MEIIVNDFSCILPQRSKKYHDHLQLILIHHYADAVSDMFLISSVISKALGLSSKIKTIQLIHFEIFLHQSINLNLIKSAIMSIPFFKRLSALVFIAQIMPSLYHSRLIEPPSRASMWRLGFPTPVDQVILKSMLGRAAVFI